MANTSATGGYLVPAATPLPLEDDALIDFLHDWIVGVTGLDNTFVRPRWQPEQPNIPKENVNWLAVGIVNRQSDYFPAIEHDGAGDGKDRLLRHEELELMASFYGPNASGNAQNFKDGMMVAQNREVLQASKMDVIGAENIVSFPEQVKDKWMYRADLTFHLRRQIIKDYPVLNILTIHGTIHNKHTDTNFTT